MKKKLRVGVIFGGRSGEHEVSLRSAEAIIANIDAEKYEVVPIAITKKGRWLASVAPQQLAASYAETSFSEQSASRAVETASSEDDSAQNSIGENVLLIEHEQAGGLARLDNQQSRESIEPLDVIFPVLHGTYGEDGTIQGLFETYNIPYVGCGVLASACGMDKIVMKRLFQAADLPVCRYAWFLRGRWECEPQSIVDKIERELGYPVFVKPANLGSSVGISKATDRAGLELAINLAAKFDRRLIVEQGLDVREIECAVMGNDTVETSLPGEYVIHEESARFLDYTEKYSATGHTEFLVPAQLSPEMQTRVRQLAAETFRSIDGAGLARVDFFIRRDTGELLVNELNTMPGFTPTSGYPKMWQASGLSYPQLLDRLIQLALERHADKGRNQTSL